MQILSFGSPPRLFLLLPFSLLLLLVRLLSFSVIYKRRSIDRSWLTRWRRTRGIAVEKPTDEDSFTHGNHGLPTQVHALHNESRGWNLDEVCVYRQNWAFFKIFPKTAFFFKQPAFFRSVIFVAANFSHSAKNIFKRNIPSKFPFSKDPKKKTKNRQEKKTNFFWNRNRHNCLQHESVLEIVLKLSYCEYRQIWLNILMDDHNLSNIK